MPRSPDLMSGRFAAAIVALAAATVLLGMPALASEFAVQSTNTNTGVRAARVTVEKTCTAGDATVPNGTISSDPGVEPCGVLTANDVDVVSGTVRFRAGEGILFGDGFSVSSAATFTVETGETVLGAAYVRDESPAGVGDYRVAFYIDPDNLTLSQNTEQFEHVVAYDAQGAREFLIGVTYNTGLAEKRLFVTAFEDDGTARTTKGVCELALGCGMAVCRSHLEGVDRHRRRPRGRSQRRHQPVPGGRVWDSAADWTTTPARSAPSSGARRPSTAPASARRTWTTSAPGRAELGGPDESEQERPADPRALAGRRCRAGGQRRRPGSRPAKQPGETPGRSRRCP